MKFLKKIRINQARLSKRTCVSNEISKFHKKISNLFFKISKFFFGKNSENNCEKIVEIVLENTAKNCAKLRKKCPILFKMHDTKWNKELCFTIFFLVSAKKNHLNSRIQ